MVEYGGRLSSFSGRFPGGSHLPNEGLCGRRGIFPSLLGPSKLRLSLPSDDEYKPTMMDLFLFL